MATEPRCACHHPDLLIPPGKGDRSPAPPQVAPGEEVQDLLLAARDGGQSFHNGAGCLPRGLRRRSEEHLRDRGEEPRLR